jgi:hypothetical protein
MPAANGYSERPWGGNIMTGIEHIERLIQRMPAVADEAATASAFWMRIDEEMEAVWGAVQSEEERKDVAARYFDLVEMAEALGLVRADD